MNGVISSQKLHFSNIIMSHSTIIVVGSCNIDLIAYTQQMPLLGQTVIGQDFKQGFGGKGANQAVAAAKLGASVVCREEDEEVHCCDPFCVHFKIVCTSTSINSPFVYYSHHQAMVSKLGQDQFGTQTLENFRQNGVDTRFVSQRCSSNTMPSGVASILVDSNTGKNVIVVIPGANFDITAQEVEQALETLIQPSLVATTTDHTFQQVLVCQLEIPLQLTRQALSIARARGVLTILNPAPAHALPDELYADVDVLCPNETEATVLTGLPVDTLEQAAEAATVLFKRGVRRYVIVTLGERGCLVCHLDPTTKRVEHRHVAASKLNAPAVDTTGAGDAFIGALAYFLAQRKPVEVAAERANRLASLSVTRLGTQSSYPHRADIDDQSFWN
jgi:ribokinase